MEIDTTSSSSPSSSSKTANTITTISASYPITISKEDSKITNNNNGNENNEFNPLNTVRDAALTLKRKRDLSYEDECYTRDESSLYLVNESQDALARRCICLSNIFRSLTFVPGNETILAKSTQFLGILGRLLLLNHEHLQRNTKTRNYDREEDLDFTDSCSSLQGEREWWWDYLISIRENMLVALANIAGHLELSRFEEIIARPLIDGLLHWAVCTSAHGQDPFPAANSALSPQRLALEALCKLCVTDANVDMVIATPPFARLEKLCAVLTRHLCRNEDQVLREFSVNLLHYLAAADSAMSRTVALQAPCISYLVAFIEQAEQTALGVANQHGINYLRDNPDSMGTSLDMLRRAAGTLLHLARHPDNRSLFMQQEQRLLGLVMSHILDQQVALMISRVLFQVSRGILPLPSIEYRLQQRQQNEKTILSSSLSSSSSTTTTKASTIITTTTITTSTTNTTNIKTDNTNEDNVAKLNIKECNFIRKTPSPNTTLKTSIINQLPNNLYNNNQTADENSNSSSQLIPAASLNDVSNSSTNSNSCSTAASCQSGSLLSNSLSNNLVNSTPTNLPEIKIVSTKITQEQTSKNTTSLATTPSGLNCDSNTNGNSNSSTNGSNISLNSNGSSRSSSTSSNGSNNNNNNNVQNSLVAPTSSSALPTPPAAPPTPATTNTTAAVA